MGDSRAMMRARAAWGEAMPAPVRALAEACDRESQSRVAGRIRRRDGVAYSPTVINQVLARRYPGDMPAVMSAIRAALIQDEWHCPGLGEVIGGDACWDWQAKARGPSIATSSHRMQMRRACRSCPHFRDRDKERAK